MCRIHENSNWQWHEDELLIKMPLEPKISGKDMVETQEPLFSSQLDNKLARPEHFLWESCPLCRIVLCVCICQLFEIQYLITSYSHVPTFSNHFCKKVYVVTLPTNRTTTNLTASLRPSLVAASLVTGRPRPGRCDDMLNGIQVLPETNEDMQ